MDCQGYNGECARGACEGGFLKEVCVDVIAASQSAGGNLCQGLFVGLCGRDVVYYADGPLPAEDSKTKVSDFRCFIGGPAANAAITFAKLGGQLGGDVQSCKGVQSGAGVRATLVTCLGDGQESRAIKRQLEDFGIEVIDLAEGCWNSPNISCIYVNTATGSRTIISGQASFGAVPVIDFSAPSNARGQALAQSLAAALAQSDFCLYDCNLNAVVGSLAALIANSSEGQAGETSTPLVMDCGAYKPGTETFLSVAAEVIASQSFVDDATGARGNELCDRYPNMAACAMTRGGDSVLYAMAGRENVQTGEVTVVPAREVVDTLGAGDVFHGAYCYYRYAEGLGFVEALDRACEIASASVQAKGPTEGIDRFLKSEQ